MSDEKIRIALIQTAVSEDIPSHLDRTVALVEKAVQGGSNIICLQELFRTRYFCSRYAESSFGLAETVPGPTTEVFSVLAKKHGIVLIVPVFEKRAEGIYHNSAVVILPDGSLAGVYRKLHIPDDPCYYEKYYFTPGDPSLPVFKTPFGMIGVLICWDQWFPEAARLLALQGARIIFYPTAIGWIDPDPGERTRQKEAWELIQRSHAVANGIYVAAANRTGREESIEFWGGSFVTGPQGEILARGSENSEQIVQAECDLKKIGKIRCEWPFFRDRRVDAYGGLLQRFTGPGSNPS